MALHPISRKISTNQIQVDPELEGYTLQFGAAEPEALLWVHVLMDSILRAHRDDCQREYLWLFEHTEDNYIGSFNWICDNLGIDSTWAREQLWRGWRGMNFKNFKLSRLTKDSERNTIYDD